MAELKRGSDSSRAEAWPALPLDARQDTCDTLHMWTQIVGEISLALKPHVNHWWRVPFYLTARGLTTSPIPYADRVFELSFDFIDHVLLLTTSRGEISKLALVPRSVADFYQEFTTMLRGLGIEARNWPMPVEVPDPIPFA